MMAKFRKNVVIEAWLFSESGRIPKPEWPISAIESGKAYYQGGTRPYYTIETLEGALRANIGDWIIRGIANEIYPCRDDIFRATYEAVE